MHIQKKLFDPTYPYCFTWCSNAMEIEISHEFPQVNILEHTIG